jgi:hypothetical protein
MKTSHETVLFVSGASAFGDRDRSSLSDSAMADTVDFSGDSRSDPESDNDILFETLSESDYSDLENNKTTPVIPPGTLDPLSSPQTPDPCSRDSNPLPVPHYLSFLSSPELQQTPTTDGQIDFFRLIFDDEMCDFIVNQTNAYADSLFVRKDKPMETADSKRVFGVPGFVVPHGHREVALSDGILEHRQLLRRDDECLLVPQEHVASQIFLDLAVLALCS